MTPDLPASPEVRVYGDERRNQELSLWLQRIYLLLLEAREEPDVPVVNVAPTDLSTLETLLRRDPVTFDPEAIADALARRLPPDHLPTVTETLSEVTKQLQRLNKKVTGLSTMPSGGSSGHTIIDSGIITSITQPVQVSNFPATTEISNDSGNPIPVSGMVSVSEPVTVDGTVTAVSARPATTVHTSVAASLTNVTLLAANANRHGATIYNDSSATLTLKLGATASVTSFTVKMVADAYYEVPFGYTGIIDGLWGGVLGSARVCEVTA